MGGSAISSDDMKRHYDARSYSSAVNASQIFTSKKMLDDFNPATMKLPREACDSALSPRSRAIIFAEDVTGSMGSFLLSLIQNEFPRLINETYKCTSYNPHIMFMGVGDVAAGDRAPLQVTQFETDLRMLDQLEKIYLEKGGGGNRYESYILPWYFASKYTKIDCFEKRGEKGFLFTFGDEEPTPRLKKNELDTVFGGRDDFEGKSLTGADCLEMASKMYYCYHIILHGNGYGRLNLDQWSVLMDGHACDLRDHTCLPELVTTILRMYEGYSKSDCINQIGNSHTRKVVQEALVAHEETVEISSPEEPAESTKIEVF